jgi:hypothetical protein
MKKLLTIICLLASTITFAAQGYYFEYKMTSAGSTGVNGTMKLYGTADGNGRSEMNMAIPQMPGGGTNMIGISKAAEPGVIYMLFEKTKTYTKMDVNKYANQNRTDNGKYEIVVIGKESVNGYNSTHFKVKYNGKETMDMWTSKDVIDWSVTARIRANKYMGDSKMYEEMKAKGVEGFAVRILSKEGEHQVQMDLVKAEKKEIAATLFDIPADYKEGSMMQGVMGGSGMPAMDEIMKMTPEEREKWLKQMQEQYKGKQ